MDSLLKPAAARLQSKLSIPKQILSLIKNRKILTIFSSHHEDKKFAINSVTKLSKEVRPVLIIIPRHVKRAVSIQNKCSKADLKCSILLEPSENSSSSDVYFSNQIDVPAVRAPILNFALIGGTYCNVNGHNLSEPIKFGVVMLHGPKNANF